MTISRLDIFQALIGITETVESHAGSVHERKVQTAHFPIGPVEVIEDAASANLAAPLAQQYHRQLVVVMVARHHARAINDHRIIEQCPVPFLDAVEPAGDVRQLFREKLVHLQPIRPVGMRQEMVDHVIDVLTWPLGAQIRESQG